ncbi:MAG: hypothetical protein ABW116_05880, partial [Candidatus Sedimenticola sp. 20ELBAFRAG]
IAPMLGCIKGNCRSLNDLEMRRRSMASMVRFATLNDTLHIQTMRGGLLMGKRPLCSDEHRRLHWKRPKGIGRDVASDNPQ